MNSREKRLVWRSLCRTVGKTVRDYLEETQTNKLPGDKQ